LSKGYDAPMPDATLRIGELARRSGVSADLLRAWERRYALLEPTRTAGGYRLYSAQDESRVSAMQAHLAQGLSAAEAARLARGATAGPAPDGSAAELAEALWSALDAFDDAGAQSAFDRLMAAFSTEAVATTAILPYLRTLGDRWRDGDASVAQEHFASALLRARLLALGRGWDRGAGPRALLACPAGERHDLGLVVLGLALRDRSWRVTFLGPDTPIPTLAAAADRLDPDVVVLSAHTEEPLAEAADEIAALAASRTVLVAGPGAGADVAARAGAQLLAGGPVEAAEWMSRSAVRPNAG
jgi:DNA-binding transcriptional MerR regulator/methylmalonyl-CoA mutase cobalamin-binding subunit